MWLNYLKQQNYINVFFVILFTLIVYTTNAEDILGCGGFIKSDAELNFSQIQVKLYTKQGSLKDKTDCAPNNGYYFLPLYDRGEYILKIEPPTGWSFEPSEVALNVDGQTDPCSQGTDINFIFKGFGITGTVESVRNNVGPEGVTIKLEGPHNTNNVRETVSSAGGQFYFTPVIPGKYTIRALHSRWKFISDSITVEVKEGNTELPKGSIVISGFDISGSVVSDGEPIKSVHFILLVSQQVKTEPFINGCDKIEVAGFKPPPEWRFLCHVQSDEKGQFLFPSVSSGKYRIMSHYHGKNIQFDVQPAYVDVTVVHSSVQLESPFEVKGFTVKGKVLTAAVNGKGIARATVFVDGKPVSTTKADGSYTLENVRTGTYSLHAEAPDVLFTKQIVKISPGSDSIETLIPSSYKVCGRIVSPFSHRVAFSKSDQETVPIAVIPTSGTTGEFCHYLAPGHYTVKVVLTDEDKANGIQFYPFSHSVNVVASSPPDIVFSQLKAVLSGTVQCPRKEDCNTLVISLQLMSSDDSSKQMTNVIDGKYTFSEIPPGRYEVAIADTRFCWLSDKQVVVVNSATASVPPFITNGYVVHFQSSHQTKLKYKLIQNSSETVEGTFDLPVGLSTHCVKYAGNYEFIPFGCHGFKPPMVNWSTDQLSREPVNIVAETHSLGLQITSVDNVNNLYVYVFNTDNTEKTGFGNLKSLRMSDKYIYEFKLFLQHEEKVNVVPVSSDLLFKPKKLLVVGGSDCIPLAAEFIALKGKTVQGKIIPPLSNVLVTVSAPGLEPLSIETGSDGVFKFGPLDGSLDYTVKAEKEAYVFSGPDTSGNFNAHKLAEIIVEVVDQADGSPLQGVLLSVSGGESYRRNLQTTVDGKITFNSLSPNQYFLRPMMKEYIFEPNSKMISIEEGQSVHIKLSGKRTAFSVFGRVISLGGLDEAAAVVEAVGYSTNDPATSFCAGHTEEATADASGQFRVRGLQPKCSYSLYLKQTASSSVLMSRPSVSIPNVSGDIKGLQITALQPPTRMDITAHVYTPNPEHYRALRVKLCHSETAGTPLHSVRLDPQLISQKRPMTNNPGVFVILNSLPLDNRNYFVQLESSLSQATHNYKIDPVYFQANMSFKHVNLGFYPKTKASDQDINQSSVWILPFALFAGLLFYNAEKVFQLVYRLFGKVNSTLVLSSAHPKQFNTVDVHKGHNDAAEIEQIVQTINAVKSKPKSRKT